MVEHSPAMIEALEDKGYDVGYVGEHYEAGVYLDDAGEARLRAEGYKIGETVEDDDTWLARKAEIAATTAREALAAEVAQSGLTESAKAKGAVTVPGEVVILRAYTFTNYAGRFLYVEAHNKPTTTTPPARHVAGPTRVPTASTARRSTSATAITPDGGDAAIGGNKIATRRRASYMYHRGLVALRGADANLQAGQITVRVASTHRRLRHQRRHRVDRQGAAAARGRRSRRTSSRSTWTRPRSTTGWTSSTAQFPDIMRGHQPAAQDRRLPASGHGDHGGHHEPAQRATRTRPTRRRAVQLFSKAHGPPGGNNITAEFKDPAAARRTRRCRSR